LEGFRRLNTFKGPSDKSQQDHHLRTHDFLLLSEQVIVQRDDGLFQIGWGDEAAGPRESRAFAEAVAARGVQ
jgi:hypothetical protein